MKDYTLRSLYQYLVILTVLYFAGLSGSAFGAGCGAPTNPIEGENCLPGNPQTEWDITGAGDTTIQGFTTDISYNTGSRVDFKIKTNASAYTIDIYRLGYYQGNGARKVKSILPSVGLPQTQPACVTDTTAGLNGSGLSDCGNWAVSASWDSSNAVSGIYFALLTRTDTGGQSHIFFIVRNDDDVTPSDLLFQTSDTTWQAYNSYGLGSLYGSGATEFDAANRSYKVSYNRPFLTRRDTIYNWFFNAEYPMVRWLEANGFDVSYISGVDSDRFGARLLQHKVFLSVGHDEYWSGNQRANVETARAAGIHLAFFSGNEVFWKTRWENSIDGSGTPYRTLVCYKETLAGAHIDPQVPATWTGTWRDPRFSPPADGGRPENALTGTLFMVDGPQSLSIKIPAADGKMRFWRNTSVAIQNAGQVVTLPAGSLGFEWDIDADNGVRPAGLFDLSTATYTVSPYLLDFDFGATYGTGTATHHMTLYRAPSGALVFGAGTIQWSWGLDSEHDAPFSAAFPADIRMQQATYNLFADMGVQPATPQGLTPAVSSTDTTAPSSTITSPTGGSVNAGTVVTVSGTAADVGGAIGGVEVSVDGGTSWHPSTGRNNWSYSWTPSNSGSATLRSRAVDDSGNIETPAGGVSITVDPRVCPCSSWGNVTPRLLDNGDAQAVELGVKFRSDVSGFITGIRFYKGSSNNTGTHVGHLWTSNGTLMAAATFTGESASGWQQVTFSSAVAINANTTYLASYFAPSGHYSVDVDYFTFGGVDNAPLHLLRDGVDGANGVFTYGSSGGFPTSTFQASNYWVDVVFTTSGGGATGPAVNTISPASEATGVNPATTASATFNKALNPATVTSSSFQLLDPAGNLVAAAVAYNANTFTATLTPSLALNPATTYTAFILGGSNGVKDTLGNPLALNVSWSFTTCCSGWSSGSAPATLDSADTHAGEYGVKFRSDVDGFITAIRFYKSSANTGTHVGHLWKNDGTLVASATFVIETASGWQQAMFSSPVAITAGTTYVASYFAPNGHYSVNDFYFASAGVDNQTLHFLRDGVDGPNGVFQYGITSAFPASTFQSRNYWVDVAFSSSAGSSFGLMLTAVSPVSAATGVSTTTNVSGTFNRALDPTTVTSSTFRLFDPANNPVPASVGYNPATFTATLTPTSALNFATTYKAVITGGANGVKDTSGNPLSSTATWSFTTAGACPCSIWNLSTIPATVDSGDANSGELGLRFRSEVSGVVVGIRFYKAATNSGTHLANLWSNSGSLLASASFSNESASGWQQVNFSAPVAITANTTYVVSYFAPNGHYSVNPNHLRNSGVDNAPLHALADGSDGANGVFLYAATSAFPTTTFQSSNYWVDVVFNPVVLSSLTLNPTSVGGGSSSTGTVTISGPAPTGGVTVALASDNPVAQVPPSVLIPAGNSSATFGVSTSTVATSTVANISGTYGTKQSAGLTVNLLNLNSVTLNPTTVVGGISSTGTVTLNAAAPSSGTTVLLSSSNTAAAQVPTSVTVPSGATSATFTILTSVVTLNTSADISASYGATKSATLAVNAAPPPTPLAIDAVASGDRTSASTTVTTAAFSTAAPNELLLAFISADSGSSGGQTVTSVAGAGLNWTLVRRTNAQPGDAEIWRSFATSALNNVTVTANLAQNTVSSITVVTFTGSDLSTGASAGASAAAGAPTASLVTTRNNSWVFGVGTDWDNAISRTVPANQTMVHPFLTSVSSTYWVQRQNSVTPLSGTTVTINDTAPTADRYDLSLVEVLQATSAAGPDFTISATPASQTVQPGAGTQYTTTIAAQAGFSGKVTLNVTGLPQGVTATFSPATVTGSGSSTLTVNTLNTTALGSYSLTITAINGALSHTANITLLVNPPPAPGQLAIDTIVSSDKNAASTTASTPVFSTSSPKELLLAFISADSGVSGGMTVTGVTGAGLGWSLVSRANSQPGDAEIWRAFATSALNNVSVTATLAQSVPSSITVVTFTGADSSGTNGAGAIGATAVASAASGAPSASLVTTRNNSWVFGVGTDWDQAILRTVGANQVMVHQFPASVGSTYWVQRQNNPTPLSGTTVTINDTAPTGDKYDLSIVEILPPGFTVSATPVSQSVQPGSSKQYAVTVGGGFSGTVNLSVSGLPQGATGTFNPVAVAGSGSSTLTIDTLSTTPLGTYSLTITGASGSLIHTTNVTLGVSSASSTQLAIDSVVSGDSSSTSPTVTTTAFSTTVPNELLVAFISADSAGFSGGQTVTSISGGGLTWILVRRANAQPGDAEIWRAFATAALTNVTVTATLAQSAAASITVVTFIGADPSGIVGAANSASAASGAPSASLVTTRNNSWVFGVGTDWDRSVARTLGVNQIMVHSFMPSVGSTYWVQRQTNPTPLSGTTVTINDTAPTNDKYDLTIVEIISAP